MQQRQGTADQWTIANPVLGPGELAVETDTGRFKIGDGINHWSDLQYFIDQSKIVPALVALGLTQNQVTQFFG